MGKKKWTVSAKRADFGKIAAACGISPILARLIRNRDVVGVDETRLFLEGGLEDLHDPRLLPDAGKAVDLLAEQIKEGKRIRIIGDYDVDGICASYTLWYALRQCGADADAVLPERMRDGYGINERLVRCAAEDGIDTIITCDNGIAASEPLIKAAEWGMTVIVKFRSVWTKTETEIISFRLQRQSSIPRSPLSSAEDRVIRSRRSAGLS